MEARTVTASASSCPCVFAAIPSRARHLLPHRFPSQHLFRSVLARSAAATTFSCRPLSASQPSQSSSTGVPCQQSSRRRVRRASVSDRSSDTTAADDELLLAGAAIEQGLLVYKDGDTERALQLFQRSLTLPGTGMKRFRDKPREISDEEKQAALYNTACCLGRLGEPEDGLKAVAGCLDSGYTGFGTMRNDPDMAPLRESPKFEGLLKRFEPGGGFLGGFLKGFN